MESPLESGSPRRPRRRWLRWSVALALAGCAPLVVCDLWVRSVAAAQCHESVADVPRAPVALVLGCSETLPDGRDNLYFARRIDAAAELFHGGAVERLIVSGDNHAAEYDEPTAMKAALVERGVPAERIHCDYAGFRTLDSVVRAELVFGQRSLVIVSQRFHAERAVFLARSRGLEASGYCAKAVGGAAGLRQRAREVVARTAAVLDAHVLGTQPKFLGEPIELGDAR
jgi:SanA protein